MKKRLILLIIITTVSLSVVVGCSKAKDTSEDTTTNSETQEKDDSAKETPTETAEVVEPTEPTETPTTPTEVVEPVEPSATTDEAIATTKDPVKDLFTSAINKLYNTDYSTQKNKDLAKEFAQKNFSEKGAENITKNINEYNSSFTSSELLITNVKEIQSENANYPKAYEIIYNVVITSGKPSSYSDLIGIVLEDSNGKLFIDSLSENNF
ncbi:hypothetical protein H7E67_12165 [Clostridium gasigenes]|uniref:hypothetical protein n=1 Tax=Clostridium gasigenes TaxID=94869 RepID=UPI0014385A9E|nr:hypothetical protein [Clostridium gasigenes]MBB6624186.1 hypothetical protein [Clostridium gasigenes]MBU3088198.1 hypothetical protein [Clostridium gasigenes]MBU3134006.1 hypothetical protein [Clostridium gasigenes]MBU3137660.1 hypothetical protein [Clostridium gasigenes]NKF08680.1 hypothetical protein [Clostridium gasigenes]